jgi:hypothetical protein
MTVRNREPLYIEAKLALYCGWVLNALVLAKPEKTTVFIWPEISLRTAVLSRIVEPADRMLP